MTRSLLVRARRHREKKGPVERGAPENRRACVTECLVVVVVEFFFVGGGKGRRSGGPCALSEKGARPRHRTRHHTHTHTHTQLFCVRREGSFCKKRTGKKKHKRQAGQKGVSLAFSFRRKKSAHRREEGGGRRERGARKESAAAASRARCPRSSLTSRGGRG